MIRNTPSNTISRKKARNFVAGFPLNTPAMTYFIPGVLPSTLRACCAVQNVPDVLVTWDPTLSSALSGRISEFDQDVASVSTSLPVPNHENVLDESC